MTSTTSTILLPFQPDAMPPAQLAVVSHPARYSGHTHALYAYQLEHRLLVVPPNPRPPGARSRRPLVGRAHWVVSPKAFAIDGAVEAFLSRDAPITSS